MVGGEYLGPAKMCGDRVTVERAVLSPSIGVLVGAVVLLAVSCGSVLGVDSVTVPSGTNVSATVTEVWSAFPWVERPGEVALNAPGAIASDSEGRIFVLDAGDLLEPMKILVLNREFQVEEVLGSTEDVSVEIPMFGHYLSDIAVDSRDRVYVCDASGEREYPGGPILPGKVHVLHPNLSWLGNITIPYGDVVGSPDCIAIDDRDRLIVGQFRAMGESRVMVFAPSPNQSDLGDISMVLEKVFQLCPPGEDCGRRHGWPRDISVGPDGRVIVAEGRLQDIDTERIVVLDREFRWLGSYGSIGKSPGHFFGITSAVVDPTGVLVAADSGLERISFFFPNGTFAGWMGRQGSDPGEFDGLGNLMVVGPGQLLVPDLHNRRIQRVEVDLSTLHPVAVVAEGLVLLSVLSMIFLSIASRCEPFWIPWTIKPNIKNMSPPMDTPLGPYRLVQLLSVDMEFARIPLYPRNDTYYSHYCIDQDVAWAEGGMSQEAELIIFGQAYDPPESTEWPFFEDDNNQTGSKISPGNFTLDYYYGLAKTHSVALVWFWYPDSYASSFCHDPELCVNNMWAKQQEIWEGID